MHATEAEDGEILGCKLYDGFTSAELEALQRPEQ
jgi:hypothetical protein